MSNSVKDLTRQFEEGMVRSESAVSLASLKSRGLAAPSKAVESISIEHHIPVAENGVNQTEPQPSRMDSTGELLKDMPLNSNQSESTYQPNSSEQKTTDESADTSASLVETSTPSRGTNETRSESVRVRSTIGKTLTMDQEHSPYETSDSSVCQGQTMERTAPIVPPSPQESIGNMVHNMDKFLYTIKWSEGGLLRVREGNIF